jgi:hypothetical protein
MGQHRGQEAICGIISCGLGLAMLIYLLLKPGISTTTTTTTTTCSQSGPCQNVTTSLPNTTPVDWGTVILDPFTLVIVLPCVAILAGAVWDARRDKWYARVLLWFATTLLTVGICPFFGKYILPAWLLVVAASWLAFTNARSRGIASA